MDARQRAELKALANQAQVHTKDRTAFRLANGLVVLFAMLEAAEAREVRLKRLLQRWADRFGPGHHGLPADTAPGTLHVESVRALADRPSREGDG